MSTETSLRLASRADLPAIAEVYLAAREVAAMPPGVHPPADVRTWVGGWDLATRDVWVAESDDRVVGFANLTPTWLDGLYVDPGAQRRGVGSTLVEVAKSLRPDGFGLWVFEMNAPARAFYRAHGFVELERTDGSANEERAPDVKMVWPGVEPLACFRSMIDEVDELLGDVLARRVALTRAVQDVKISSGRDAAREADVVRRVAAVVPELGEERVARIVHAIITESLDAARPDRER
ncbi:GNAT family N-acetyltransferase [Nocardioides currus]|uniref:GNAT family N-acetyltransferase n=1 Tax=Nocardioides currus TaxID=2133958 RepID=A0A2R7YVZ4_9ACTN|nr:GNAT family N-acetyltransferase [Nocardioides currus]PUA80545.1 hypothetical protein C7S10_12310 [Nocardioides currus]